MNICLSSFPIRLEIRSLRPAGGASVIEHASVQQAGSFLKASSRQTQALPQLRALLFPAGLAAHAGEDEIWREAARRLMRGDLYLVMPDAGASGGVAAAADAPAPEAVPRRAAVTPPIPPPQPRKAAAPAPAPAPAFQDATRALDQNTQAATLQQAARHGTPFCALCEKLKAERAAAAQT